MRTALIGAVEGSLLALEALAEAGASPGLVVTLPAERRARHSDYADLAPPARRLGADLHFCVDVNAPGTVARLRDHEPDVVFVIGWSRICRQAFLAVARSGTIGFHPSLLPKMRGRAVIPWTILTGQTRSGSTLFWLDEGVDSGPILLQREVAVAADETALSLYQKHNANLRAMLIEAVSLLATAEAPRHVQDHAAATYCARRTPADGWIDWRRPAGEVWRFVRALGEPYPGAFTWLADDRLIVWSARPSDAGGRYIGLPGQVQALDGPDALVRCGDGRCIALQHVQRPGEPRRSAGEVLRPHIRLGAPLPVAAWQRR